MTHSTTFIASPAELRSLATCSRADDPALLALSSPVPPISRWNQEMPLPIDRDRLFAEFTPLVRRLIRQYGSDAELRQELPGVLYCRFCTLLEAYDSQRGVPLRPYLVRQLTAAAYTYARRHRRRQQREVVLQEPQNSLQASIESDPTEQWDRRICLQQAASLLPQALAKLTDRQRKVVIWRYFEERSFEEIARILQVQPATVRSLLRHAINSLRKQIETPFGLPEA